MPVRKKGRYVRRTRRSSKLKKKLQPITFAVISILLSTLVLVLFSAYKFINAPFTTADIGVDFSKGEIWNESGITNIVLVQVADRTNKYATIKKLALISFDTASRHYSIYYIPVDVNVEYALNYGEGPLAQVYAAGNADQGRGTYLLQKTLLKILAVRIDGFVLADAEGLSHATDIIGRIDPQDLSASLRLRNIAKLPGFISDLRTLTITDLKIKDIIKIFAFLRNTSFSSSYIYQLGEFHILDPYLWDDLWKERFNLNDVSKEGVKVFILNASSEPKIPGLASWGGRVAENLGASVLDLQNSFIEFEESAIITEDRSLKTVSELAKTLGIEKTINVEDLDKDKNFNPQIFRTEVTVVLIDF